MCWPEGYFKRTVCSLHTVNSNHHFLSPHWDCLSAEQQQCGAEMAWCLSTAYGKRALGLCQPGCVVAQMLCCPVLAVLFLAPELAQASLLHTSMHNGGIFQENPWGTVVCVAQGDCLHVCMGVTVLCVTNLFHALRSGLKCHFYAIGFSLGLRKSELTSLHIFIFT